MQALCRFLFGLWVAVSALQSFALNIDGSPLFYFFLIQILLVGLGFFVPSRPISPVMHRPLLILSGFSLVAAVGAFALPIIFEGMPVFAPRISIDEQMRGMMTAQFGISNIAQVIYLSINLLLIFFAAQGRYGDLSGPFLIGAMGASCVIALSILAEFIELPLWNQGLSDILRNNEAGAIFDNLILDNTRRISGVFSEPSYAGLFSSGFSAYFLSQYLETRKWMYIVLAIVMAWCVVVTTSMLGFVGLVVAGALIVFRYARRYFIPVVIAIIAFVFYYLYFEIEFVDRMYLSRSGSSNINRLTSDMRSLEILKETYFVGVGLGSHRASGLLSTLAACTGIVGLVLYISAFAGLLLMRVSPYARSRAAPLMICATVVWVNLLIGAAELSTPSLWAPIVALVSLTLWSVRKVQERATRVVVRRGEGNAALSIRATA